MESTNKKPNKLGFKKSKLSVLPIIFSSVLAAGALTGSGFGIARIAKNYTESPEFTRSVKGRIKIDPAAALPADKKQLQDFSDAKDIVSDSAEKLSRWLKDNGQDNYDVSYEIYDEKTAPEDKPTGEKQYWGYLNAQFELDKITRKHPLSEDEEDEKIDNDPYLTFFSDKAFNSNEKTLVYRWYVELPEKGTIRPQYSIIPFRQIFNIPKKADQKDNKTKILTNKDGANGVMYAIDDSELPAGCKMNDIYKNFAKAKKLSDGPEEDKPVWLKHEWGKPRFYIVNNLEGLYNEANYHISNWWVNQNELDYLNIYDGTTYKGFAEDYKQNEWNGETRGESSQKIAYRLQNGRLYDPSEKEHVGAEVANVDLFNFIDQKEAGTIDANSIFANKYINDIITMDEIDTFFPEKITDDYKNVIEEENPKINYFWYGKTSKSSATKYLGNQINYGFNKAAIHDIEYSDLAKEGQSYADQVFERITQVEKKEYIDPTFTETIFGGSNLVGMLSLGFLLFLIALLVILAVLYRTTGVMSWICMIFALSMTGLIATAGATAISMSLLLGLFTMAIAGFIASLAVCGRMKRRLLSHEDTQLMIQKTFKKSLLPVVDVTVLTLIFGVCMTYIAPMSLNALGLVLIAGSFMTFISLYLINGLLHILFFNNQWLVNKYIFFGKPSNIANEALTQGHNSVPLGMDATKLEIPFYSSMSKKRIDDTGRRALIAVSVVGGLLLVAIILFSVLGYTSSNMYHTTYCVAIKFGDDLFSQDWFKGLDYLSYRHESTGWWYFYTNAGNAYSIAKEMATAGGLGFGSDILVQNIFGSTNQDILNNTLIAVAIGATVTCVYGLIRYNWISFVPMVATVFAMPLLMLGIAAASQIKFDQSVVIGFVLVVVINALYSAGIIGAIHESWSRKDAYGKPEFKFIMNTALTNCWTYIWTFAASYALFILIFGLTAPKGLILLIGLFIIGCGISTIFVPFVATFLLYQFTKVRNFALNKKVERNKNKVVVNYDDIDEQGIEGLNQFTKKIPVVKSQPAKETNNGQQATN